MRVNTFRIKSLLFMLWYTATSQPTDQLQSVPRVLSSLSELADVPESSWVVVSSTISWWAEHFMLCFRTRWMPTSSGYHRPGQHLGTKDIIMVGCFAFIQLQNSSDLWTDQQSIVHKEHCVWGSPSSSFLPSKYGVMISLMRLEGLHGGLRWPICSWFQRFELETKFLGFLVMCCTCVWAGGHCLPEEDCLHR